MGIGAITYYIKVHYIPLKIKKNKNLLIFFSLIVLVFLANTFNENTVVAGRNTALVVLTVAFLIYLFDNKGIIYQASKVKIFNYLGLTSYSFY